MIFGGWEIHCPVDVLWEIEGKKGGGIILHLKSRFSAELGWKKIVDIKEGFWHISICPTFNRKLKFKKNIFRLQLLLAEG